MTDSDAVGGPAAEQPVQPELLRRDLVAVGWRQDRINAARQGTNPTVLRRLSTSFAVIGDVQFLPGYCVLLIDRPGVDRLSDLPRSGRRGFLSDLDRLAESVENVCRARDRAFRRVNLEIQGNLDPFLHAHVWPRYGWEPAGLITGPVGRYPPSCWRDPSTVLGPEHDLWRTDLKAELDRLG